MLLPMLAEQILDDRVQELLARRVVEERGVGLRLSGAELGQRATPCALSSASRQAATALISSERSGQAVIGDGAGERVARSRSRTCGSSSPRRGRDPRASARALASPAGMRRTR